MRSPEPRHQRPPIGNGEILNWAASLVEVAQGQLKILLAGTRAER
jgi:hypothetical protein